MDIAKLAIEVDASQATAAAKQLDSMSKSAKAADSSTTGVGKASAEAGKEAGNSAHKYRMAAMQLSQVASQGSVTGSYIQALAIQLPDLAMGLGTVGIVAGALAGALAMPLVNALSGASNGIDDLIGDLDALDNSFDVAADGSYTLSEELVRLARISENAAKLKVAVETEQARKSILNLGIAIKEQSESIIGSTKLSVDEQNKLRAAILATVQSTNPAAYENLAAVVSELDSKYREATDAARENLKVTSMAARQAGLTGEQKYELANAANAARRAYLSLNGTMGTATEELAKYVEAGIKAADIYKRLKDGGTDWESLLKRTNKAMAEGMDFGPSSADYYAEQLRLLKEANAEHLRADDARLASRASALKAIEAIEVQHMSQQDRLTDNYLTQQYQIAAALGQGVIDVQEANALKLASDKNYAIQSYTIALQQQQQQMQLNDIMLSSAKTLSANLVDALEAYGAESTDLGLAAIAVQKGLMVAQAIMSAELAAVQTQAAYAALAAVTANPALIPVGEANAQVVRGMGYASAALIAATEFAPARALGGQVEAGKTYMWQENGIEYFTPGMNGYVTPNDKLGGSNQTVVLQISTGVSQTVRAEMAAMMPGIVKMIGQATQGARR